MPIIAICKDCGKQLDTNGAIVIPPPNRENGDKKLHQCLECYDKVDSSKSLAHKEEVRGLNAELKDLRQENKRMYVALNDIVSHYWVSTSTNNGKWINEFVEIAEKALSPEQEGN